MKAAVVQGASRGLGLGIVRHLLERGVPRVHATCRDPDGAVELQALGELAGSRLRIHRLDLVEDDTIERSVAAVREENPRVHLLFNASGVLHGDGLRPERRWEELDRGPLLRIMEVNAVGPLLVTKAFLPLLKHDERAVIASLSARVGSIGDNRRGGWYGYRSSKAALNQLHRSLAIELSRRAPKVISVVLHPGTVETQLTEPFRRSVPEGKLFTVDHSVRQLLDIVEGLESADHGRFFDYAKAPIEW